MSGLVPRNGSGPSVSHPAAAVGAGSGRTIEESSWDRAVINFDEFADVPHTLDEQPVADAVTDDGLVRRRRRGRMEEYFRRRVGFRAWPSGIVVVVREQPLTPLPDGRMRVQEPYGPPFTSLYLAAEPVTRRIGEVATNPSVASEMPVATPTDRKHERALSQLAFLPAPVRRSVLQRAPQPSHFIAEAVRLDVNSLAPVHRVSVLRMDERDGIVVVGSRQHRAIHWQVEQRTYVLRPGSTIAASTPLHPLP